MAKRQVLYSFHYERDVWRAANRAVIQKFLTGKNGF